MLGDHYLVYRKVDFGAGAQSFTVRASMDYTGDGALEIRLDSPDGQLIGTCPIQNQWWIESYANFSCNILPTSGIHDVYLIVKGDFTDWGRIGINWFKFDTETVPDPGESPEPTSSPEPTPPPVSNVYRNMASGKTVTCNAVNQEGLELITDGDFSDPDKYALVGDGSPGGDPGPTYVQIDLGKAYYLDKVNIWHYYGSQDTGRIYRDVIVQLSNDPDFNEKVTVFNNDNDNSAGQGKGRDKEFVATEAGKEITFAPVYARYLRVWTNGNTDNPASHIVEIQAWGTEAKLAHAIKGTPVIDGIIDAVWENAHVISDFTVVSGRSDNEVKARVMWDEENIYALFEIKDSDPDGSYESDIGSSKRDAVELYIDETNEKPPVFSSGKQYYVIYDIKGLFVGDGPSYPTTGKSAVTMLEDGYMIECSVPMMSTTLSEGKVIGFDMQVDDAKDGARVAFIKWNDMTGNGWRDASLFGNLKLVAAPEQLEIIINNPHEGKCIARRNSAVPIMFTLKDAGGNYVKGIEARLYMAKIEDGVTGPELEAVRKGGKGDNIFENVIRYERDHL